MSLESESKTNKKQAESVLVKLVKRLPWPVLVFGVRLAGFFIKAGGKTPSKPRQTIRTNLLLTHPHMEKQQRLALEEASIESLLMSAAESLKVWISDPNEVKSWVKSVEGLEHLTDALNNPNGTIALVPHLGTWEVMNAWVTSYTTPTIMYKPSKDQHINELMLSGRQRLNAQLVPTDPSGVKAIFRTLKEGGFTAILPDHTPTTAGGVMAPFFNIPVVTTTLVGKLASKTNCRLIGMSCFRCADGGFKIYIDPLTDEQLWSKDAAEQAHALNRAMETLIARAPEQYSWTFKRFRNSGDALKDVYNWNDSAVRAVAMRWHKKSN